MYKGLYALLFLALAGCYSPKIVDSDSVNVSIDSSYSDTALATIIKPYKDEVNAKMNEVIALAETDFVKYAPSSPLSNLVCDIVFEKGFELFQKKSNQCTKSNTFCLLNFGGLRAPISKGNITVGNIYELMPFDNSICVVTISAGKMKEFATYIQEKEGQPISNAFLHLANNHEKIEIGGEEYDFAQNVNIITSDYLATGGDKMNFLKNPIAKSNLNVLIRDVLIDYLKGVKKIGANPTEKERINLD